MKEQQLHELALLFMNQFAHKECSLDEFLELYNDELTVDERNLGYFILRFFN